MDWPHLLACTWTIIRFHTSLLLYLTTYPPFMLCIWITTSCQNYLLPCFPRLLYWRGYTWRTTTSRHWIGMCSAGVTCTLRQVFLYSSCFIMSFGPKQYFDQYIGIRTYFRPGYLSMHAQEYRGALCTPVSQYPSRSFYNSFTQTHPPQRHCLLSPSVFKITTT